ncbi:MAG TPA: indole-3-glycerol phosphate synthase TrpC [Acidimicrobiales bacterium]|nr:indole-3-glycerol phosphate synthase TrpC [Acidimicrobiales bacterium]
MATYLDAILAAHRAAGEKDGREAEVIFAEAGARAEPVRDFEAALRAPGLSVIAEVKRRSPSKGDLAPDLDPAGLARAYAAGGAACLSVLTDVEFFGGSAADLAAARAATELPVLRKDFTVSALDVADARLMGADAILLIAAALSDAELAELAARAAGLGLTVLHEVHDEAELERVLDVGATLVGVNQRDLFSFEVDTDRAVRVGRSMPDGVVRVAESGISGPEDAVRLTDAGFDAVLVGESLVRSPDPAAAVAALRAAAKTPASRIAPAHVPARR